MAAALLALLLLNASSGTSQLLAAFDHAKSAIKADVGDKASRKEALAILERAEKTTRTYSDSRAKTEGQLLDLIERHDARAEAMRPVLDRLNADNESYQEEMIRYRLELKSSLTREDWGRIFPSQQQE